MCGICARVGPGPADPGALALMTRALAHRGPDGEGWHVAGGAGLGHRRLSIIDLEGGAQPMANRDRTLWLTFNGEIYNHAELRTQLTAAGHQFRTRSDTEVILHLYAEHGDDCVSRLRGMFAFVLWDERRQRLLAARDHLGQKPLYYATRGDELLIASEIKALLAVAPELREVDPAALDEYFSLRLVAAPRSMFRSIRKLPPAHRLVREADGAMTVSRYWDVNYEPKWDGSLPDLLDELEERLVEALRACLVSDVPVGAFLSGGLDSGLLVALLHRHGLAGGLQTFTVGLPYGRFDEAPAARVVAARCGTRHREETVTGSLLSGLPRLVRQLDEPSDPLAACTDVLARLAARHVKVVIGGDGGDEIFGGYDRYYGNHYAGQYARLPAMLRRRLIGPGLAALPEGGWYKSVGHQLRWLHRLADFAGGERYVQSLEYFYLAREFREQLYGPRLRAQLAGQPGAVMREGYENAPAREPIDRMLYADLQSRLPDHPLMIQDRMTMAHGLEARSPYLDHRLVEFVARLPAQLKVRGRTLRYAQQQLAKRYLPPEVLARKKQGFASALPYLLREELARLHRVVLDDMQLARDGWLDQKAVRALAQEHATGRVRHGNRLWLLVNAELWYQLCIQQREPAELEARIQEVPPPPGAGFRPFTESAAA